MHFGPGYIKKDGTVLLLENLNLNRHYQYESKYINPNSHNVRQVTNLFNWIRINDSKFYSNENIVELPIQEISLEQYDTLLNFLDYLAHIGTYVEIAIEGDSQGKGLQSTNCLWYQKFDFSESTSDEIIKEIHRQYNKIKYNKNEQIN